MLRIDVFESMLASIEGANEHRKKQGLKPKITMSNNPLESIRMLVSIGLGWSVLPKTLVSDDLKQLDIKLEMNRQLGMVWHPGRTQSKAVKELIKMMK